MLILSRNKNQPLIINENITVTVLSIEGNQIKLGTDAPKEVAIQRDDAKTKEKSANLSLHCP